MEGKTAPAEDILRLDAYRVAVVFANFSRGVLVHHAKTSCDLNGNGFGIGAQIANELLCIGVFIRVRHGDLHWAPVETHDCRLAARTSCDRCDCIVGILLLPLHAIERGLRPIRLELLALPVLFYPWYVRKCAGAE